MRRIGHPAARLSYTLPPPAKTNETFPYFTSETSTFAGTEKHSGISDKETKIKNTNTGADAATQMRFAKFTIYYTE